MRDQIVEMAPDYSERSLYIVSEATVYRLLKAHDLISSPAYVMVKTADRFHTKAVA